MEDVSELPPAKSNCFLYSDACVRLVLRLLKVKFNSFPNFLKFRYRQKAVISAEFSINQLRFYFFVQHANDIYIKLIHVVEKK